MKKNKFKLIIILSFFMGIILALGQEPTLNVKAAVPTTSAVYQDAPDGLKLDGLIDIPSTYKDNTADNAKLITSFPVNIVQMLSSAKDGGATTQVSSFWGKHSDDSITDNYFDLTQPQVISAWVYFGDTYHDYPSVITDGKDNTYDGGVKDNKTADGLALVLQNDNRGAQAISGAISQPSGDYYKTSGGESLGVWGTGTTDGSVLSNSGGANSNYNILEKGGIQKSFAVEFDTVNNYKAGSIDDGLLSTVLGKDDYLDSSNDIKGQHLAYGYPGSSSYYNQTSSTKSTLGVPLKTVYRNSMKHSQGSTGNNIEMSGYGSNTATTANAWKHVTFKYTPPASKTSSNGTFTIAYNDQERDGAAKPINQSNIIKNKTIDISQFQSSNYRVRWGFTGATGSQYSEPRTYSVILQRMPNVANLDSEAALTDMSQYNDSGTKGRKISDLYQNENYNPNAGISSFLKSAAYNVANGDILKFNYDMNYLSGTIGTGKINATIELPQKVDFTAGLNPDWGTDSVGKVTYSGPGASDDDSFEIPAKDITTDTNGNPIIKLNMNTINTVGMKASIELYGKANSDKTAVLVPSEPASIRSDSYIEDLSSPAFIINDQMKIASTDELNQTVDYDKSPSKLTGTLNYVNKSKVDSNTQFYTQINDNAPVAADGQMTISSDGLTGSYSIDAPKAASDSGSQLHVGKNTITVYAIDSIKRVSNEITYTITVKDFANLLLDSNDLNKDIDKQGSTTLTSNLKYDNGGSFKNIPLTFHWNIDGKDQDLEKITDTKGVTDFDYQKVINGTDLGAGAHVLKLYVSDGTRNSNTITFNITVKDKQLVATPDDDNITVNNNDYVNLTGSYAYSDASAITDHNGAKVTYTIKNGDNEQDPVSYYSKDGKIDLTLKPLLLNTQTDSTILPTLSYDEVQKILADPKATGLRVGRNEVTVTVTDTDYKSNTVVYVVNVPDVTPVMSTKNPKTTTKNNRYFNADVTYEYANDKNYQMRRGNLFMYQKNTWDDDSKWMVANGRPATANEGTPLDFQAQILTSLMGPGYAVTPDPENANLFRYDLLAYDPYGRKSNPVSYETTVVSKELSLTVNNHYKFKSINRGYISSKDDLVGRNGDWDIDVTSFKATWKLYAQQTGDFSKENSDGTNSTIPANLIFVDKQNNQQPMSTNQLIASDDSISSTTQVTDIGASWENNNGILLAINGPITAGEYSSKITWTLVDSGV